MFSFTTSRRNTFVDRDKRSTGPTLCLDARHQATAPAATRGRSNRATAACGSRDKRHVVFQMPQLPISPLRRRNYGRVDAGRFKPQHSLSALPEAACSFPHDPPPRLSRKSTRRRPTTASIIGTALFIFVLYVLCWCWSDDSRCEPRERSLHGQGEGKREINRIQRKMLNCLV